MVTIKSLSHSYADVQAMDFENWQIKPAEKWLLLGNSGSGKTTLLHMMTGILKPSAGEVIINGTSIYDLSSKDLDLFRGRNIGIVFQRPHLIKSLTVLENLIIVQSFANLPKDMDRIHSVLASLNIIDKRNAFPNELSQGQLQRVSIARAVLNQPALLFADEPTSSLDDKNTFAVLDLLLSQSELNQTTLVVATHDKRIKDSFNNIYEL